MKNPRTGGANAVRKAIEGAEIVPPPSIVPEAARRNLVMLEDGLYRRENDLFWVCAPFKLEAETIDEANNYGLLLSWRDRDGNLREEVFGREMFAGECGELRARLSAGGLTAMSDLKSRQAFAAYLNTIATPARARVVGRTGWHQIGTARVFVLPNKVLGEGHQRVILQAAARGHALYASAGALDDWQRKVAAVAVGNTSMVFAISCAFAGPLLTLTGNEGGGFHLEGKSKGGKTTVLRAAASVWGGTQKDGAHGFVKSWRSTDNGLEAVAAAHNDALLCIDELGQTDGKSIGNTAYMLGNGVAKLRSDRNGLAREQITWRLIFLSTGEVGLAQKAAEARQTVKAGQEVRFVGVGFEAIEQVHDEESVPLFLAALQRDLQRCYGTAGPAFVRGIIQHLGVDPKYSDRLRERLNDMVAAWLSIHPGAANQVSDVARRFALVALAGELAGEVGVTGWPAGVAEEASARLFRSWLAARGSSGAREDMQAIEQLRAFIGAHGIARFERWEKDKRPNAEGEVVAETAPVEKVSVQHRAGWRRWIEEEDGKGYWRHYLTREAMAEALLGLDFRASVKVLADAGYITRDKDGKSTVLRRPPGVQGNMRLFEVHSTILGAGVDDLDDGAGA